MLTGTFAPLALARQVGRLYSLQRLAGLAGGLCPLRRRLRVSTECLRAASPIEILMNVVARIVARVEVQIVRDSRVN
jgi:hypothetical protein